MDDPTADPDGRPEFRDEEGSEATRSSRTSSAGTDERRRSGSTCEEDAIDEEENGNHQLGAKRSSSATSSLSDKRGLGSPADSARLAAQQHGAPREANHEEPSQFLRMLQTDQLYRTRDDDGRMVEGLPSPLSSSASMRSSSRRRRRPARESEDFSNGIEEAGKLNPDTVGRISMTTDRLFRSYPTWLSVVVTAALGVYAVLLTCAIVADAFILWSNIPGITSGETGLVIVGKFSLHELIGLTWSYGGYSSAIFIVVCSLVWPIVIVGLMLWVWFGELQLRTRSRILRWVSRLGTVCLYFFFFIIFLDSFLQVTFFDAANELRVIRGEPGWAVFVYLADVILLLVLTEWIYVLHYNAVYLLTWKLGQEHKSLRLKWYFGNATPFCRSLCCVNSLVGLPEAQTGAPSRHAVPRAADRSDRPGSNAQSDADSARDGPPSPSPSLSASSEPAAALQRYEPANGLFHPSSAASPVTPPAPAAADLEVGGLGLERAASQQLRSHEHQNLLPGGRTRAQSQYQLRRDRGRPRSSNRSRRVQRQEGWRFAESQTGDTGKKSTPKSLSTDMEFIRGGYRFACSLFGEIVGIFLALVIAVLGVSAYSLPVFKQTSAFQLAGSSTDPPSQTRFISLPEIGMRLISNIDGVQVSWIAGVIFIVVTYFALLFALPIFLHCISSFCAFFPVQHFFGKRFLRALCHACNLLSVFAAFEVAMMVLVIFSYDVGMILLAMMERGGMHQTDNIDQDGATFDHCATYEALTICLGLSREYGIVFGLLVAAMNIPYLYYFSETYHRHFGLVADGRNEQSYASGETTHKHRAEGCIVYLCYRGHCCSRKSYIFRQESVNEDPYYRLQRSDNSFMEQVNRLEDGKYASSDANGHGPPSDGAQERSDGKPEAGWRARRRSLVANFGLHSGLLRGLPSSPSLRSPGSAAEAEPPASADRPRRRSQRYIVSRSSSQPPIMLQTAALAESGPDSVVSPGAASAASAASAPLVRDRSRSTPDGGDASRDGASAADASSNGELRISVT